MNENWGSPPELDVGAMDDEAILGFLAGAARVQARWEAVQLEVLAEWLRRRGGDDRIADQLACELTVTIGRAGRDLSLAYTLTERLPNTLAALRRGELDRARVDTIDRATDVLSAELARVVDARLYPKALALTPGQLARYVRNVVADVDPEGAAARAQERQRERRVSIDHETDGMSWLNAFLRAEDAVACWDRVNRLAREVKDPARSMDQVRADVVRDLLLGTGTGTGTGAGTGDTVAHVYVTVDAETLLGLAERAGEVRGYGPLPAGRVRELAYQLTAEWTGVLLDRNRRPVTLTPNTYRFRGKLAELIRLRDCTCQFPACNRAAQFTDIDRVIPFHRGGPTSEHNGHSLCRRHHRLKQHPQWTVKRGGDGVTHWTTVAGRSRRRTYTKCPEPVSTNRARSSY